MAQQTAVEWLVQELENVDYNPLEKGGYDTAKKRIIEQAKAMEKDQICEAWQHGKQQTFLGLGKVLTSEEYYNETYNK